MSKYGNKKCEFNDGNNVIKFDSKVERARYIDLLRMQQRGEIGNLRCQPRFLLLEKFSRNGRKFQAEFYVADFEYRQDYQTIVEDVKGVPTTTYLGKRKHFLKLNPDLAFREVKQIGGKWEILEL